MVYRNLISIGRNMNPSLTSHLIQKWLRTDPGVQRGHLAPLLPLLHQGHQTAREKWCRLHRALASLRAEHLPTVSGNAVSPFLSGFSLVAFFLCPPSVHALASRPWHEVRRPPAATWAGPEPCSAASAPSRTRVGDPPCACASFLRLASPFAPSAPRRAPGTPRRFLQPVCTKT